MQVTLDQWAAFRAVVEEGSFAKAAETLDKSQSGISYAVAQLQDQLPVRVLELKGRKAEVTEAGKVLYRQAVALLEQSKEIESSAKCLAAGWQTEVTIAVDIITPMGIVLNTLEHFSNENPGTRIKVLETSLSGTDEALFTREADLVVTANVPPGFLGESLGNIAMVAVTGSHHPLAKIEAPITESELKQHRQIVVRDSGIKREQDVGWLAAEQRWTVSSFSTSVQVLTRGLGFAFVPRHFVRFDLEQGRLKELKLSLGGERKISLYLVPSAQSHLGPAVQALYTQMLTVVGSSTLGL